MRKYILLLISFTFALLSTASAQSTSATEEKTEKINIQNIIFGHTDDAYEWHIANIGENHIIIPLPVILWSEASGWNVFLSSQFEKNNGTYNGSPERRRTPLCAFFAKLNAFVITSTFLRWLDARYVSSKWRNASFISCSSFCWSYFESSTAINSVFSIRLSLA